MNCAKCGTVNAEAAERCVRCGEPLVAPPLQVGPPPQAGSIQAGPPPQPGPLLGWPQVGAPPQGAPPQGAPSQEWSQQQTLLGTPSQGMPQGAPQYGPPQYGSAQQGYQGAPFQGGPWPNVPGGWGQGYGAAPQTSGLAIASLVVGVLSIFCGILAPVGLIMGIMALRQIRRDRQNLTGDGLAIGGIVTSAFAFLVCLIILPAILLPVFVTARERAKTASCMNNLKQQSVAMITYAQDYDEHYPPAGQWEDKMMPYIKSEKVLQCPNAPEARSGYAFNSQFNHLYLAQLKDPRDTMMIFDANASWNGTGGAELLAPRHMDAAAIAFADGHVQRIKPDLLHYYLWDPAGSLSDGSPPPSSTEQR